MRRLRGYETSEGNTLDFVRSRLPVLQHPLRRFPLQFSGILQVELLLDLVAVCFNRVGAEVEAVGNRASRVAVADELKDFQLAVTEILNGRCLRRSSSRSDRLCRPLPCRRPRLGLRSASLQSDQRGTP